MDAYIYGEKRSLPDGFAAYGDRTRSAVISIDMHQGHLADTPDCPCPGPRAQGSGTGGTDRRVPRRRPPPRRADHPCPHHPVKRRRRRHQRAQGRLALRVPDLWRAIPNSDEHAIEGTRWTEFMTRVEPDDMTVNTKKRLSAFHPTDLDFLLRNMDVRTVVLNGGFTDCCILNAAFEASNLG